MRLTFLTRFAAKWMKVAAETSRRISGRKYRIAYDPTVFVRASRYNRWRLRCFGNPRAGRPCRGAVPANTAGVHYSSGGGSRFAGRHLCLDAPVWLFSLNTLTFAVWFGHCRLGIVVDDAIVVVENVERRYLAGQKGSERRRQRRWMKSLVPFFLLPRC